MKLRRHVHVGQIVKTRDLTYNTLSRAHVLPMIHRRRHRRCCRRTFCHVRHSALPMADLFGAATSHQLIIIIIHLLGPARADWLTSSHLQRSPSTTPATRRVCVRDSWLVDSGLTTTRSWCTATHTHQHHCHHHHHQRGHHDYNHLPSINVRRERWPWPS